MKSHSNALPILFCLAMLTALSASFFSNRAQAELSDPGEPGVFDQLRELAVREFHERFAMIETRPQQREILQRIPHDRRRERYA